MHIVWHEWIYEWNKAGKICFIDYKSLKNATQRMFKLTIFGIETGIFIYFMFLSPNTVRRERSLLNFRCIHKNYVFSTAEP